MTACCANTSKNCYSVFRDTPQIQEQFLNNLVETFQILEKFPTLQDIISQLKSQVTLSFTDKNTFTTFANQYKIPLDTFNIDTPFIRSIYSFPKNITELQISHLDASPVRRAVLTGRLTVNQALANTQLTHSQFNSLTSLQKQAIRSGFTVTQAKEALAKSCLTSTHLEAFKKGLVTFSELTSLRASQAQGLLLGLDYDQVLPEWFQGVHCRAIAQHHIPYETLEEHAKEPHQVKTLILGRTSASAREAKESVEGTAAPITFEPNMTPLHLAAIKSPSISWVTSRTASQFSEVEIRGLLQCGLTPAQVKVPWFQLAHCIALESTNYSYDDIRELTVPEVRALACGLTRKEVLQPAREGSEFTLQMARLLEVGITFDAVRLVGALTPYQENAIIRHGLKPSVVTQSWFKEEHSYALDQGILFNEIQGLTGPQAFGLTLGLSRREVHNIWFSTGHVKALQAGLPYDYIQYLSGLDAEIASLGFKPIQ